MLRSAAARVAAAVARPRTAPPAWCRGFAAGDGSSSEGEDGECVGDGRWDAATAAWLRPTQKNDPHSPPSPAATTPPVAPDDATTTTTPTEASDEWRSWADSRLAALTGGDAAPAQRPRPPPRATIVQPPTALPSPFTGYAELGGGASPTGAASGPHPSQPPHPTGRFAAQRWAAAAGRLHPGRVFYPGQTYTPSDLAAGAGAADPASAALRPRGPSFTRAALPPAPEIRAKADFRDARFLASLLTDTGRLPPRRRTRLPQAAHRHVMRQVKLARQMALLHPLTKHARADGGGAPPSAGEDKEAEAGAVAAVEA